MIYNKSGVLQKHDVPAGKDLLKTTTASTVAEVFCAYRPSLMRKTNKKAMSAKVKGQDLIKLVFYLKYYIRYCFIKDILQ